MFETICTNLTSLANLAILKNLVILVFTNLTILVCDSCEYGDLRKSGESCDSIESCFFSGDFGDF